MLSKTHGAGGYGKKKVKEVYDAIAIDILKDKEPQKAIDDNIHLFPLTYQKNIKKDRDMKIFQSYLDSLRLFLR